MKIIKLIFTLLLAVPVILLAVRIDSHAYEYTAGNARVALRQSVKLETYSKLYDFNRDGAVTAEESRIVLRQSVHLPVEKIVVKIDTSDLTLLSFVETEDLKKGLYYPLKNYAQYFVEAERTYGVNAIFLAAVAAQESGWGKSWLATNRNNFFGWTGGSWATPREGIMEVSRMLSQKYLTTGGPYYHGKSISSVNKCYNGSQSWVDYVTGIMYSIYKDCK